jgi:hypothetical protein
MGPTRSNDFVLGIPILDTEDDVENKHWQAAARLVT